MSSNEMKESGKSLNVFMSSKGPVFDDVDAAFDAAATTASPAASIANESTKPLTNDKGKSRKDVRFSLESKSVTVGTETLASLGVTTVTSRSRSLIDTDRLSLSPSDISRASTAPPKPLEKDTLEEEAEELEDEKEAEDEEPIVADPSNDEQAAPLRTNQPDDEDKYGGDFLDNQDDDDDDDDEDDELLPPPPPDSPEPQRPDEDDAAIVASSSPTDFPNADDDEDGEEDQDGFGYEMANNEEGAVTPAQKSAKANNKDKRSKKRDPSDGSEDENSEDGTRQFTVDAKNKKKKKSKKREVDESEEKTPMPRKKAKRLKAAAYVPGTVFPKGIAMPYEYTSVPVSNFKDYDHDGKAVRRSQRARIPPLEFWKGEKVTWGPCEEFDDPLFDSVANMPVPIAIEQAQPTPYKQRKVPTTKKKHPEKGMDSSKKSHKNGHGVVEMEPFDNTKIRKKYPGMVFDSDEAYLWDEATEESTDLKVLGYKDSLPARALPMGSGRQASEGKVVCRAAQAFNISNADSPSPGYLMGNLILPPRGIKDAESVGTCAQTFTCVYGQPGAIEVAFGDPDVRDGTLDPRNASRYFVKQGDMFRIPPGNCYRLENHSREAEAYLTWTIIRPSLNDSD